MADLEKVIDRLNLWIENCTLSLRRDLYTTFSCFLIKPSSRGLYKFPETDARIEIDNNSKTMQTNKYRGDINNFGGSLFVRAVL